MTPAELNALDHAVAEKVFGWVWINGYRQNYLIPPHSKDLFHSAGLGWGKGRDEAFPDGIIAKDFSMYNHLKLPDAESPSDAMAVLKKCYEHDPNDCLSALHNFLIRRDTNPERKLTELQICQFAVKLFQ